MSMLLLPISLEVATLNRNLSRKAKRCGEGESFNVEVENIWPVYDCNILKKDIHIQKLM